MGSVLARRRRRGAPSDATLIDLARAGDLEAYGTLFERHEASARALARQLSSSRGEADDAVSEAFERVLGAIRRGNGPRDSFRPYLLTTVRRTAYDRTRREQRTGPTDDEWVLDQGVEDPDPSVQAFERDAMTRAFESLPERWQTVLWHTEIEETPAEELAVILGVRPNALAALAYRAREGLRQAYVVAHVDIDLRTPANDCRWTLERLAKYIRGRVSEDACRKLERHLDGCSDCRALYFEMADVGITLRAAVVPLVFGGPAVLAAVNAMGNSAAAGAGVASLAGFSASGAAGSGVAASGVAAASSASVVAGVAAATVATVGGALVLPTVTTMVIDSRPAAPVVAAAAMGRTLHGIDEPIVIERPASQQQPSAPVAASPSSTPAPAETSVPSSSAPAPDEAEGMDTPADDDADAELGDDLIGDIGTPLVITPPVPSAPDSGTDDAPDEGAPDFGLDPGLPLVIEAPPTTQPVPPLDATPDPALTAPPTIDPVDPNPTTVPPATEPPVTVPTVTSPPVTVPPVTVPTVTVPPVTEPPVSEPPTSIPPTSEPRVSVPPPPEPPTTFVPDGADPDAADPDETDRPNDPDSGDPDAGNSVDDTPAEGDVA